MARIVVDSKVPKRVVLGDGAAGKVLKRVVLGDGAAGVTMWSVGVEITSVTVLGTDFWNTATAVDPLGWIKAYSGLTLGSYRRMVEFTVPVRPSETVYANAKTANAINPGELIPPFTPVAINKVRTVIFTA